MVVSARVLPRSAATGLYWAAPAPGSLVVYANATAAAAAVFTLADGEDGTYSLLAPGAAAGVVCVTGAGGAGPLAATAASNDGACTRLWLYGTTAGSYALLSAASGLLVAATSAGAPMYAHAVADPRDAAADGARFWIESPDGAW